MRSRLAARHLSRAGSRGAAQAAQGEADGAPQGLCETQVHGAKHWGRLESAEYMGAAEEAAEAAQNGWSAMLVFKVSLLFFLAGLAEIGGGWLVWAAMREGRPMWWAVVRPAPHARTTRWPTRTTRCCCHRRRSPHRRPMN